jgi:outer membrane murein-binding lipoprotein Lpp
MVLRRLLILGIVVLAGAALAAFGGPSKTNAAAEDISAVSATSDCQLNGDIKHVIYLIFDNTHFLRDNPNVPSDLEQMPHLLNFLKGNGTLLTNDHTVLISHTANGILTSLTGMYSDRHGQAVSNSYRYFRADGSTASSSSFKYWTDLTDDVSAVPTDPNYNMVNADGGTAKNTPAPWVPYTRAGCDFGATALANVVLENTGTGPNGDMTKVFGSGSAEWNEAVASNAAPSGTAARNLAQTDFVGMAIHCAADGGICAGNAHARPDLLPDEPGGYAGFLGLFGAKYVNPAITGGSAAVNDLNGNPIGDQFGQPGFPGFDGLFARTTLAYVAQMQEAGIPVTFGYISDAHDSHGVAGEIHIARGPGEQAYVDQLKSYDDAFAEFFARLAADGIDKSNTLFVVTNEEGDHFVGAQPTAAGCDGVTTPCTYSLLGEINANLAGLMATQQGITTPFTVHADMAPTIYITGNPARTDQVTRNFGRALGRLTAVSPYTGQTDKLSVALADPVGMKALHMVTADPQRTPTLTMFADPDYFLFAGAPNCTSPCVTVPTNPPTFAWNHGSIDPEIATTWLGMVGPGVRNNGQDGTWADHTDTRPTMLSLLGLGDTYVHDGRVLIDQLDDSALPQAVLDHRDAIRRLGAVYKQLNAPFGDFSQATLVMSTNAIKSDTADDTRYISIEGQIAQLTNRRDALATQIRDALDGAAFADEELSDRQAKVWIKQAQNLIAQAKALAAAS